MSSFESTNHEFFYRDRMRVGRVEAGASCACNQWHEPYKRGETQESLYRKYVKHVQDSYKALRKSVPNS